MYDIEFILVCKSPEAHMYSSILFTNTCRSPIVTRGGGAMPVPICYSHTPPPSGTTTVTTTTTTATTTTTTTKQASGASHLPLSPLRRCPPSRPRLPRLARWADPTVPIAPGWPTCPCLRTLPSGCRQPPRRPGRPSPTELPEPPPDWEAVLHDTRRVDVPVERGIPQYVRGHEAPIHPPIEPRGVGATVLSFKRFSGLVW
jgi:hypothetical protein